MNWHGNSAPSSSSATANSFPSSEEDFLIKQLLLAHDPDGRWLDSELLISAMENVMSSSASHRSNVEEAVQWKDEDSIAIAGSEETLGQILWKISSEARIKKPSFVFVGKGNQHGRTMALFDLLGSYRWDAKVALVLASFAASYGQFWLINQLHHDIPLASSIAMVKQLPRELIMLRPRFKALNLLLKTMVDVTKCIIKFEGLPLRHVKLDVEPIGTTKLSIYVAAYWVVRSSLSCFSLVADLTAMKPEKVHVFSSLKLVLECNCSCSMGDVEHGIKAEQNLASPQWAKLKMSQKLPTLFWEEHHDNQDVLEMLLALKDNLPLKEPSTKSKLGVTELKDKVVILLISKPQLLPLDELLLLVHQTYGHSHHKEFEAKYRVVWVPVTESDHWTETEKERFSILSNSLPWYSLNRPWALHSSVVNFIRLAWQSRADPTMVVLDSKGAMTNLNGMDMVLIWGANAFPFSAVREQELLAEQKQLTLQLLVDEIDPLLAKWVEEGRNICIYGSENLDWINELNTKAREIMSCGIQLEMVYVGSSNIISENVGKTSDIIHQTIHRNLLSSTKVRFFWLRIESLRRSKLQQGGRLRIDHILQDVSALLQHHDDGNDKGGWIAIGSGTAEEIVRLEGRKAIELLSKVHEWGENVGKKGFLGAIRASVQVPKPLLILHPAEPCSHSVMIPYGKGQQQQPKGNMLCEKCRRVMKPYVVYK
ncbi:unnamed protein product [Linum tenue]|uniref:Protein SIEVE ELEMENT OCCLUSION C n=1 Tax=Linum tenue TaxID=586396 RepID=A0AAV0KWI8_9ROSI|nr:unnamed protein product [Linum tenue]